MQTPRGNLAGQAGNRKIQMKTHKTIATLGLWSVPIATFSGGMYGDWLAGVSVGLSLAALSLLILITLDIWKND